MGLLFKDDLHDRFGTWPLSYIPYGGADFGEVQAVAQAVGDGDDSAFHTAWISAANALKAEAEQALEKGQRSSARELFLRASCFYATSYHPLYGQRVDPRLVVAQRMQVEAFDCAMALSDPPVAQLDIPFKGMSLPAYFIPAEGRTREVRPLLILTNGYDATITDMYFASAVAASRRGFHCLLFDGPGQGNMLVQKGIPLRPDWENVIKAVMDIAVTLPLVDAQRIALNGWSLGGYFALRAASGEHRLAACIADPGQWGIAQGIQAFLIKLGAPPASTKNLDEIDQTLLDRLTRIIEDDRNLRWSIIQRGFWTQGVDNLRDYIRAAQLFTMEGRAELIRCPTLLTWAENDPLAAQTQSLFNALRCRKELIHFTADEGAGDHCEMGNRSLFNRRALDWLDDIFSQ